MEPADAQSMFATALRVQNSVFEPLLRIDYRDKMRVRPGLAASWHQVDERNWDFELRPGVRFHDGGVMTADDVVCSLGPERFIGPNAPGHLVHDAMQPTLAGVAKLDDMQVRITTFAPDPAFEERLAGWGAQIICAPAYRRARNWQEWPVKPVATGPYRVDDFRRDESITLGAHRDYRGGVPPLGGIKFRSLPALSARIDGLLAGELDPITDLTPDQFPTITARSNLRVVGGATTIRRLVNCDSWHNPQLADVNLRRAMSLTIDRELIVDTLMGGKTTIPHGFQSEVYGPLYDPTRPPLVHDPDKARALLQQSTYRGERIAFRTTGNYYVAELRRNAGPGRNVAVRRHQRRHRSGGEFLPGISPAGIGSVQLINIDAILRPAIRHLAQLWRA